VANDPTRVVITGLGATTPVGGDAPSTWQAMLAGRSGVRTLTEDWAQRLPCQIAGRAAVEPTTVVDRVQARKLDRCQMFAIVAAREAWADAGAPDVDPLRFGVVVASGIGGIGSVLAAYDTLKERGWQRLSPFTVPMLMPNGSAGWISLGPREQYLKMRRSPIMKPVDDTPVWSVVCSFVARQYRGHGLQHRLLDAAVEYARCEGARVLEAYPIDKPEPSHPDFMFFGSRSP
jgi:GNAT superfamily N-acetyltransferase